MKRILLASLLVFCSLRAQADAGDPEVKLVSPGKAPTKTLRFAPTKGTTQGVVMTMKMQMAIKMGTIDMPATKLPAMKMYADLTVTDVSPNGDIRYDYKLGKIDVDNDPASPPAVVNAMRDALKGAEGITGKARVTSRGFTREMELSVPATANPQLKQMLDSMKESMRQLTAPLPDEAVGVGAKWQTKYRIKQNGMEVQQTADNELVSVSGNVAKVKTTLKQTADRQPMNPPGLPAGASVELIELKSSGSGLSEVDLTKLMPTSGSMQLKSNTKAHIKMSGQEQDMATDLDMTVDVKKR
ncbi:MAG TPA: DUF6263 family protein [Haliangiales bacterium]|nr:DUF6263 family protein [Haliangiales bacterium]